jgi:hypothetical protein
MFQIEENVDVVYTLREQDPSPPQLAVLTFHSTLCCLRNLYIVVTPHEMMI